MRYKTLLIAAFVTFSMALAIAQSRETGNDLFQKALDLERGKGDLDAAMQIYQQIVREFPADKPVAARALFRLGYCQELIGQAQARKSYEQLVRDYGDQKTVADEARVRLGTLTGAEPAPRGPAIAIAEMDPRTGTIRGPGQLVTQGTTYRDQYPAWSPEGKSIAFKRTMDHGDQPTTALVVLNLAAQAETAGVSTDGGVRDARERILDEDAAIGPSFWLPDSEGALASMKDISLIRYDPDRKSAVRVDLILRNDVVLAPDGKTLYVHVLSRTPASVSSTILVMDVATGERKSLPFSRLTGMAAEDDIRDLGNYFSVSPDGSALAIVRWNGRRQPHISRRGVDKSNEGETPAGFGFVQRVQWARDGRSIFFAMSQDGTRWRIMRLAVDGVSPTFTGLEVTNLTYFDLSPDGARIAFDGTAYAFAAPGPSAPR